MDMGQRVQVLEGVLAAVVNTALNEDKLPVPVVRLALADAVHAVRELERQQAERLEAERRKQDAAAAKKAEGAAAPADGPATEAKRAGETQAKAEPPAPGETKEAWNHGKQNKA